MDLDWIIIGYLVIGVIFAIVYTVSNMYDISESYKREYGNRRLQWVKNKFWDSGDYSTEHWVAVALVGFWLPCLIFYGIIEGFKAIPNGIMYLIAKRDKK